MKVTPTGPVRLPPRFTGLVLSCRDRQGQWSPYTAGWFPQGRLDPERYAMDYVSDEAWGLPVLPRHMKALLDSLGAESDAFERHFDPADSLSLMLRRVVDGRERVFECTLDDRSFMHLVRILCHVFPLNEPAPESAGESELRMNLPGWAWRLDPRARKVLDECEVFMGDSLVWDDKMYVRNLRAKIEPTPALTYARSHWREDTVEATVDRFFTGKQVAN